ncbi:MAG: hypothetical protein QM736_05065 [Vicinamibacterales bacterium]
MIVPLVQWLVAGCVLTAVATLVIRAVPGECRGGAASPLVVCADGRVSRCLSSRR